MEDETQMCQNLLALVTSPMNDASNHQINGSGYDGDFE
jgi:hypothetical protein